MGKALPQFGDHLISCFCGAYILRKRKNGTIVGSGDVFFDYDDDIFSLVYSLGGKMSGEHGIGYKKKDAFNKFTPEGELKLMKLLKKAWDPNNIMNPSKIIDIAE